MAERAAAVPLLLGVDGGNSKTDLVLGDTEGRVRAWVRGEGTRPHADTMAVTAQQLGGLIRRALREAGEPADRPVQVGAFHLANVDSPAAERAAVRDLSRLGLTGHTVVRNDVFAILRAGAQEGWGVAAVSGAGINALGVHPSGRTARFLSLGDVSGDWGGGQGLGLSGLGAAVRAGDGRGPATSLRELLPAPLGARTVEEAAIALAAGRLPRAELHRLAPAVFAAAASGDEVARGILVRLGDEIVTMVVALLRRLRLLRTQTPVVFGGGTLQNGQGILLDRIHARLADLAPRAEPRVLDIAPVAGAVGEAMACAGAEPAARERIRTLIAAGREAAVAASTVPG